MNRKLLVTLLHKNIEELAMITEGFLEMNVYPQAIIQLAKRKTEDIQLIIDQIAESTKETEHKTTTKVEIIDEPIIYEPTIDLKESLVLNELEEEIKLEEIKVEEPILEEIKLEIPLQTEVLEELVESIFESEKIIPEVEISEISLDEIEDAAEQEVIKEDVIIEEVIKEDVIIEEVIIEEVKIEEVKIEEVKIEEVIPKEVIPEEIFEQKVIEQEAIEEEVIEEEVIEQEVIEQTTETVVAEIKIHKEELKKVTIADRMANQSTSRNEKLSHIDNSLSASIANKKITDIKQAISIGDRFRFQRELFKSNGEDMNKTLTYLNQLATLDEAMSFLKSKYGWENGAEAVEDFYQIVKRKYV